MGESIALWYLGLLDERRNDLAAASAAFKRVSVLSRAAGDWFREAVSGTYRGRLALANGDTDQAAALYAASLRLYQNMGGSNGLALTLLGLAAVALRRGQAKRAASLLGASDVLRPLCQDQRQWNHVEDGASECAQARDALSTPVFEETFAQGRALPLEQILAFALDEEPPS